MPTAERKRKQKEKEKQQKRERGEPSVIKESKHFNIQANCIQVVEPDSESLPEDNFVDKTNQLVRSLNLYLQLPNEDYAEVVKDYQANFFNISKAQNKCEFINFTPNNSNTNLISKLDGQDKQLVQLSILKSNPENEKQSIEIGQVNHQTKKDVSNHEMRLRLSDVVDFLKDQGFALENTIVSYYSSIFSSFINCSLDPISKSIWLTDDDLELIDNQLSLRLKFQMGVRWQFTENEDGELSSENSEDQKSVVEDVVQKKTELRTRTDYIKASGGRDENDLGTRGRERNIGYVIEKVTQWRRLYNGYYDQNFNHHRMSLEAAAEKVGVSKKSLDDYLAQLRAGRQFGYDFNANKEKKIGDLRHFVKSKLERIPKDKLSEDTSKQKNQIKIGESKL